MALSKEFLKGKYLLFLPCWGKNTFCGKSRPLYSFPTLKVIIHKYEIPLLEKPFHFKYFIKAFLPFFGNFSSEVYLPCKV